MAGFKHRLKRLARSVYSRTLVHTGLWRLVDRWMPPRLVILAGHCVRDPETNGGLPEDMKIEAEKLERALRVLGRRFVHVTVGEGVAALAAGPTRSMVALSMDDGYKDNRTVLLPLLERTGARATIFLESRPLVERRVSWSHKWFWLVAKLGAEGAGEALVNGDAPEAIRKRFWHELDLERTSEEDLAYRLKRVLKYEAEPEARDAALDELFRQHGGDGRALCERIYLDADDVRALAESGRVEIGGHTVRHEVLATLDPADAEAEVLGGRDALRRELGDRAGTSFAYPYGRRWDFDDASVAAVEAAGYRAAVTTHPTANLEDADLFRLGRWMIDDRTPLHLLRTEAAGGFTLLRRMGIELAE